MFEKLKKAFSELSKNFGQKKISAKDIETICDEMLLSLIESDVAEEVALKIIEDIKSELLLSNVERKDSQDHINSILMVLLRNLFASSQKRKIIKEIMEKKKSKLGPYVIVFLGINGTGKTTTVAKFANLLRKKELSVLMAAADTHRAGAIEQLSQHGTNLGIKIISQRYGADPSAVARDAVEHARKNYIDAVLIDTAGRIQTSKNLMEEINKITRVIKPDFSIFVGDSLSGNDTVNQAKQFFQYTNFDGTILTKSDADAKGGAAISVVQITNRPVLFLGTGQNYDDLVEFDAEKFLTSLLRKDVDNFASGDERKEEMKVISGELTTPTVASGKKLDTNAEKPSLLTADEKRSDLQQLIFRTEKLYSASPKASNYSGQHSGASKKGLWGRLFSNKNNMKAQTKIGNGKLKQEKNGIKSDEKKGASANDKVVYLTDDEIADLDE
ncbi:MAG TPA: signal recognition particle-docking protein FtsY [Nitrososphaeraceae archaeon]